MAGFCDAFAESQEKKIPTLRSGLGSSGRKTRVGVSRRGQRKPGLEAGLFNIIF